MIGVKLANHVVLCTGYHPNDLKDMVARQGGSMADTFTKKVTMVVIKDDSVSNDKTKKAKEKNIPVYTDHDFRMKFFL
jgi:NAD-dependent DNA ligase